MIAAKYKVTLTGLNQNTFLSDCARTKIHIKNYTRKQRNKSTFTISAQNYSRAEKLNLFARYKVEKTELKSISYLFSILPQKMGIVAGAIICIVSTFLFSKTILKIKIAASSPQQSETIVAYLNKNNISTGKNWSSVSVKELENKIFESLNGASNVVVSKKGSTLVITATNLAKSKIINGPIVCPEDCIIEEITVARGTQKKQKGDIVRKGETIVEPNENNESVATIKIHLYHQSSVSVSQYIYQNAPTGNSISKTKIIFPWQKADFDFSCPYAKYQKSKQIIECFNNLIFPMKKVTITYTELTLAQTSEQEAIERAKEKAKMLATNGLKNIYNIKFEIREQNGQKFVDCFAESVIELNQ